MYNLTTINDFNEIIHKHFSDSLIVHPYLEGAKRILDVGTGAGFPGIPLAIIFPEKIFTLIDSNNKKIKFLLYLRTALNMHNVEIVHSRFEHYTRRKRFDIIISRAVNFDVNMLYNIQSSDLVFKKILIMKGKNLGGEHKGLERNLRILSAKLPKLSTNRYLMLYNYKKIS